MTAASPPDRLADVALEPSTTVLSTSELDGHYRHLDSGRNRDQFTGELLRELAEVLEDAVGLEEAEGFVSLVGGRIGARMGREYCEASSTERLDRRQVAAALVDLKRRIDGGFVVESLDEVKIVLTNTSCPFGHYVNGRESLCMMTSSVFGRIAADNLGYARVELEETIARGDAGCRVIVWFAEDGGGREFFG